MSSCKASGAPYLCTRMSLDSDFSIGCLIASSRRYLIPSLSLGTFGSIRQLGSMVKSRRDLFDLAASGLLAGGTVSLLLLLEGLRHTSIHQQVRGGAGQRSDDSVRGLLPNLCYGQMNAHVSRPKIPSFKPSSPLLQAPGLIPVPAAFLHGSLLLGKVGAWVVGPQLLQADTIFVPPSFLAGWAGLVTAALNALPLGSSDGGRACTVRCGIELPGLM